MFFFFFSLSFQFKEEQKDILYIKQTQVSMGNSIDRIHAQGTS